MQTLKNDILTVLVSEMGAELQSIVKNGYEYLWQGDPAFWGRRSPVLFPIVGSVWEKKYRVDGKEYEMGQLLRLSRNILGHSFLKLATSWKVTQLRYFGK